MLRNLSKTKRLRSRRSSSNIQITEVPKETMTKREREEMDSRNSSKKIIQENTPELNVMSFQTGFTEYPEYTLTRKHIIMKTQNTENKEKALNLESQMLWALQ